MPADQLGLMFHHRPVLLFTLPERPFRLLLPAGLFLALLQPPAKFGIFLDQLIPGLHINMNNSSLFEKPSYHEGHEDHEE